MRTPGERLVLVVGAIVFLDTMLYAVLAPLLPGLVHSLHLSKLSAGLLTASYPIGTLVGSIPGGLLVVWIGARATTVGGVVLMALSSVAFGWLHPLAALDAARLLEGLGSACSWAGGLAWLVSDAPADQRGAMMGKALGAAVGGALFGPVLGTIASGVGRPAAFSAFALIVLVPIPATLALRQPRPDPATGSPLSGLLPARHRGGFMLAVWLVALPALASGAVGVLGPLRLHHLGASAIVVGAAFLAAAAAEASLAPAIGSLSDRRGRMLPLRAGLATATVLLLCFTLPKTVLVMAALIVVISVALGLFWGPAMAMLSDLAHEGGLHQGMAAALINLAWAAGQIAGAAAGGALAKSGGDSVPMSLAAALCALTLAAAPRTRTVP